MGFLSGLAPSEWLDGYDDAFNGRPVRASTLPSLTDEGVRQYRLGYEAGQKDREEVERDYSSNT